MYEASSIKLIKEVTGMTDSFLMPACLWLITLLSTLIPKAEYSWKQEAILIIVRTHIPGLHQSSESLSPGAFDNFNKCR